MKSGGSDRAETVVKFSVSCFLIRVGRDVAESRGKRGRRTSIVMCVNRLGLFGIHNEIKKK